MSLSRFPLPSIQLVLEAGFHEALPRRPSVIISLEHDQLDSSLATTSVSALPIANVGYIPTTHHLMKTMDLRDAEPIAMDEEVPFSFIVRFPEDDELESDADGADARTIFKEKRPSTSRGLASRAKDSAKHDLSLSIISTVRKVLPVKMAEAVLRRR